MKEWRAFMAKYYPDGDADRRQSTSTAYCAAQTMVQVLKQCGDDLTRENVMKQAANLKDLKLPLLLPGITINTSPTDFSPVRAGAAGQVRRPRSGRCSASVLGGD